MTNASRTAGRDQQPQAPGMEGGVHQQYCGLAAALDVVGDRWTLLVVRQLLLGPQR